MGMEHGKGEKPYAKRLRRSELRNRELRLVYINGEDKEMNESDILTLLKPVKKKGLLRMIFSRLGLIVLLLIVEAALMVGIYLWAADSFKWFMVGMVIFGVCIVIYLFNSTMDATAKLTWLFLIMLAPIPAVIFLAYTQNDVGYRKISKAARDMIDQTKDLIKQDEDTFNEPALVDSGTDDLSKYLNRSGCFPIYEHTKTTYFSLGEYKFEALLEELRKAEDFIFLEYFIIGEGLMWGSILKILADKASEGVDVRVMFDGMCEMSTLSYDYPKRMQNLGIKCKAYAPLRPFLSSHYNYRDHRKIMVIDGKTAFTGGVNLADEYINKEVRFGHWKDTAVMVKGAAVQTFTLMFLQMWNMSETEPSWDEAKVRYDEENDGYVMPYGDCPLDKDKVGESVYIDILYRAKDYVHIMTPYLILDNELETALRYAAQRGVDVKIILPGIPDKKIPYAIAKTHFRYLLDAGVEIYEYDPGFVHAKVFVSDNEKAVVGTINLDYRSLYHHFECANYMYKTSCIADIEKDFDETLLKCTKVTPETIKNDSLFYKVVGALAKIMGPLM